MSVNVLHHARCFDGTASTALFAAFYRQQVDGAARLHYVPKRHMTGDPFEAADFERPVTACVDFRYSQRGLDWYFDHHRSAFQLDGDRDHFEQHKQNGRLFHDETAPSCAEYMTSVLRDTFGFQASRFDELVRWATIIDTARFPDPSVPVEIKVPAMRLAAFVQTVDDLRDIEQFIEDLQVRPLDEIASLPYVEAVVTPRLAAHANDVALVAERATVSGRVVHYDLLGDAPRVLNHFIPYYHHPEADYAVGIYRHLDDELRLTIGYNPWLDPAGRTHDVATMCAGFGGGGHPHVAGATLQLGEEDRLSRAYRDAIETLNR